jgi:hypothetical protein
MDNRLRQNAHGASRSLYDNATKQFGSDNYTADMYTTSSGGGKELLITIKEPNNTLTHIQITGDVTTDDLQTMGDGYITASDK